MKSFFSYLVRLNRIVVGHSIHDLEVMDTKKSWYIHRKEKYYYNTPSSFDGKEYKNEINVAEFRRLDEKRKMREKRLGAETWLFDSINQLLPEKIT